MKPGTKKRLPQAQGLRIRPGTASQPSHHKVSGRHGRTMPWLLSLLTVMGFTHSSVAQLFDYSTNISIRIGTEKSSYAVGEPVVMRIVDKNEGKEVERTPLYNPHNQIKYKIKVSLCRSGSSDSSASGKETEAPLTTFGKEHGGVHRGSVFGLDLKPGEEYTSKVYLNRLYDMTMAGKYTVVLQSTKVSEGTRLLTPTNICRTIEIVLTEPAIPAPEKIP